MKQLSPNDPQFLRQHTQIKLDPSRNEHPLHQLLSQSLKQKPKVQMNSNDYLCISRHPKIIQRKAMSLLSQGHGDAVSRIFTHEHENALTKFEKRVAKLCRAEAAALVMSGYCANTGIIQTFANKHTPIYIDKRAHASLWEGILCAQAQARPFPHNSLNALVKQIEQHGPGLIVVDALYSTTGKICPLKRLVEISEHYDCALILDETHSFGCHGRNGAGLAEAMGLADRVHFRTVGLSKAMSARGGIVLGSQKNMEFFRYECRPIIFSTSVLEYEVEGFNAALDVVEEEAWRTKKLHDNHHYLKNGLAALGYDVRESDSQILSIVSGIEQDTEILKIYLEDRGIVGSVFAAPATPKNGSMIRFSVHAELSKADLDYTIGVFANALNDLDTSRWPCLAQLSKTA